MKLKEYNAAELSELRRVHDEVKWYLGEELHRDPQLSPEDRQLVERKFAEIILNGFGKHLSSLTGKVDQQQS